MGKHRQISVNKKLQILLERITNLETHAISMNKALDILWSLDGVIKDIEKLKKKQEKEKAKESKDETKSSK